MSAAQPDEHEAALRVIVNHLPVAEIGGRKFQRINAARFYADLGWPVLPLHHPVAHEPSPHGLRCSCPNWVTCPSPAKHPLTANGLTEASTDDSQVQQWWTRWPEANIGIRTGLRASGGCGFDVIDLDGEEGWSSYLSWQQQVELPPTIFDAFTPGNRKRSSGRHLFVAALGSTSNSGVLPSVDIKGEGGYVVATPSQGITGPHYSWIVRPTAALSSEHGR